MQGVASKIRPLIIFKVSFSSVSLIDTPTLLILVLSSFTRFANYLHSNLVTFTVARNLPGPQPDREALLFAGTDKTVTFLIAAVFYNLCFL